MIQTFFTYTTSIFTAQANEPNLVGNLTDLETQAECVKNAVKDATNKIQALAQKYTGQNENLLKYLEKIYSLIIRTKDKFENNYLQKNLGYVSKDREICITLKNPNFFVELKNEIDAFKGELEEQAQAISLGVAESTVLNEQEGAEIKEGFKNAKDQMLQFFDVLLTSYGALLEKVSNLDVYD